MLQWASLPFKTWNRNTRETFFPSSSLLSVCAAISCGTPHSVGNGSFHTDQYTVGSQVSYHCDRGYHLDPGVPSTAVCLEDGSWSNAASTPRCLCQYSSFPDCFPLHCSVALFLSAKGSYSYCQTQLWAEWPFFLTKSMIFKTNA